MCRRDQIYDSGLCTHCCAAEFHSFRRDPADGGRMVSFIARNELRWRLAVDNIAVRKEKTGACNRNRLSRAGQRLRCESGSNALRLR